MCWTLNPTTQHSQKAASLDVSGFFVSRNQALDLYDPFVVDSDLPIRPEKPNHPKTSRIQNMTQHTLRPPVSQHPIITIPGIVIDLCTGRSADDLR